MSLSFSNDQIKTMTKEVIELPKLIDFPLDPETGDGGTGLIQQKENIEFQKDQLWATDQQHKVFSDNWIDTCNNYHKELEEINRSVRTLYSNNDLNKGGQSLPPHYTPEWIGLLPILIPSVKGEPISTGSKPFEKDLLNDIITIVNKLKDGFGSNTYNSTLEDDYQSGLGSAQFNTNPPSNSQIVVHSGNDSVLFNVGQPKSICVGGIGEDEISCLADEGVWTEFITLSPVSSDKPLPSGASARNGHDGWSNSERGHQTRNYAHDVMVYFQEQLDDLVNKWKTSLLNQKAYLQQNNDTNRDRKSDNITALDYLDSIILDIENWFKIPIEDVDGRYTDTPLQKIIDAKILRDSQTTERENNIIASLGTINQDGEGNVSGEGVYFDLFSFIQLRIAKSGGTLYSWYGMDLAKKHFDIKIQNAQKQLVEYENIFAISLILDDTTIGDNEIHIEGLFDLSEDDDVYIFDDDSNIEKRSIEQIFGGIITLNQGLTQEIKVEKMGRLVKYK